MRDDLNLFSNFILELNMQAREREVGGLLNWAIRNLSDLLQFDCAWYGWAQIKPSGAVIHASSTLNLPVDYYDAWSEMATEDVLVEQFLADPACVPTYDRRGENQTDGMQSLADQFGLSKMATAMRVRESRSASLFLSAYRGGAASKPWTQAERQFLQCSVDNISAAAQISAANRNSAAGRSAATVYLNDRGVSLVGLRTMRERFGHIWSRRDGDRLPRCLSEFIAEPGEHLLVDRGLVATCEPIQGLGGMALQKLTLRPLQKFDFLTARERDVARLLAGGKSHKEAARLLGVAPSTIRNQTQSIYAKLGVDNRASLAGTVSAFELAVAPASVTAH